MAGSIPQAFIDDVINRIDIVELVDRRVQLKKAGKEYTACCPFHGEKTPSFTVSPQKQFYHCFGCGAHGTAISFLMDYDHLSYVEAIEELAHILGLEVPREKGTGNTYPKEQNQPLYDILKKVAAFYQQQLREHNKAASAVDYLKDRGLTGDVAKRFQVGFAPPGWNTLTDFFKSEHEHQLLEKAGLLVKKDAPKDNQKYYDRFRNRIIFPILDKRGRVIAFGGRIIDPNDKPKYYNSPETSVFQKGRELYGMYEARQTMRKLNRFLVVEGYMDVVALAQFEINYAVATLGTSTSTDHVEAMYRAVSDIVYCFDGDPAGRKAAWRAMENSLTSIKQGRQLSFLFLPDGEDPDTMVRQEGKQAFTQRIDKAMPLDEFILHTLAENISTERLDGKARFIEQFKPLVAKLPDIIFRELLITKAAEFINADRSLIEQAIATNIEQNQAKLDAIVEYKPKIRQNVGRTPVRTAISILLQHPEFAQKVEKFEFLTTIKQAGLEILHTLIEILKTDPNLKSSALLERFRGSDDYRHLSKLTKIELLGDTANLCEEFTDTLAYFDHLEKDERLSFLQHKLTQDGLSDAEMIEYKQALNDLNQTNA